MRRRVGDAADAAGREAVEHGVVLGRRDASGPRRRPGSRSGDLCPRSIASSSARASANRARSSTSGLHLARARASTPSTGAVGTDVDACRASIGGVRPAVGPGEVDELAGGQEVLEGALGLGLDLGPRRVGDRARGRGADGSSRPCSLQAADAERPVGGARRPAGRTSSAPSPSLRARLPRVDDRALGEEVRAEVTVEHGVVAAQPLERHRRVLLLLVAVVREDRRELGVAGRPRPAGRTSRRPRAPRRSTRARDAGRSPPVAAATRSRAGPRSSAWLLLCTHLGAAATEPKAVGRARRGGRRRVEDPLPPHERGQIRPGDEAAHRTTPLRVRSGGSRLLGTGRRHHDADRPRDDGRDLVDEIAERDRRSGAEVDRRRLTTDGEREQPAHDVVHIGDVAAARERSQHAAPVSRARRRRATGSRPCRIADPRRRR